MRKNRKRNLTAALLAVLMLGGGTVAAAEPAFSDIAGHWAEDAIVRWKDAGIVNGYEDGTFLPDQKINRAEFGKILTLAFDLKESDALSAYDDVDSQAWYGTYLACAAKYIPVYPLPVAYENNLPYIRNGENGRHGFLPECNTLRMHAAEALVEIKKERESLDPKLPAISEIRDTLFHENENGEGDWDYFNLYIMHHGEPPVNVRRMFEYTYLAKTLSIMEGDPDGNFRPYDELTRAEVVTIIDRMLEPKEGEPAEK